MKNTKKEFEEYKEATKDKFEKADQDDFELEKIKKWQSKVLHHVHEMLKGRAPSHVYSLCIKEKWILF